jgi:hypothetical protein
MAPDSFSGVDEIGQYGVGDVDHRRPAESDEPFKTGDFATPPLPPVCLARLPARDPSVASSNRGIILEDSTGIRGGKATVRVQKSSFSSLSSCATR